MNALSFVLEGGHVGDVPHTAYVSSGSSSHGERNLCR
jgi:hypothetical protein